MTLYNIQNAGELVASIKLPDTPQEMTYGQYLFFTGLSVDFETFRRENPDDERGQISRLCACLKVVEPDAIDLYNVEVTDSTEFLEDLVKMYEHLFGTCHAYVETCNFEGDYKTEYKGEKYTLRAAYAAKTCGFRARFSLREATEAAMFQEMIDAPEKYPTLEAYLSAKFNYELAMLATILRKEGEELPENPVDLELWVIDRAKHFEDMPATVALDVTAFFFAVGKRLREEAALRQSLTKRDLERILQKSRKHRSKSMRLIK